MEDSRNYVVGKFNKKVAVRKELDQKGKDCTVIDQEIDALRQTIINNGWGNMIFTRKRTSVLGVRRVF